MNKGAVIFVEMYQPPKNYGTAFHTPNMSVLNDVDDKKKNGVSIVFLMRCCDCMISKRLSFWWRDTWSVVTLSRLSSFVVYDIKNYRRHTWWFPARNYRYQRMPSNVVQFTLNQLQNCFYTLEFFSCKTSKSIRFQQSTFFFSQPKNNILKMSSDCKLSF